MNKHERLAVIEERQILGKKIIELEELIGAGVFGFRPDAEIVTIRQQLTAMKEYHDLLNQRIDEVYSILSNYYCAPPSDYVEDEPEKKSIGTRFLSGVRTFWTHK